MRQNRGLQGLYTRKRIYDFLVDFITTNSYSPSVEEIGTAVGLKSKSSVYYHLSILCDMGKIAMKEKVPRSITLAGYKYVKVK